MQSQPTVDNVSDSSCGILIHCGLAYKPPQHGVFLRIKIGKVTVQPPYIHIKRVGRFSITGRRRVERDSDLKSEEGGKNRGC